MTISETPVTLWVRFRTGGIAKFKVVYIFKDKDKDKEKFFAVVEVLSVFKKKKGGRKYYLDEETLPVTTTWALGKTYVKHQALDPDLIERFGIDTGGEEVYDISYTEHVGSVRRSDYIQPRHKTQPSQ